MFAFLVLFMMMMAFVAYIVPSTYLSFRATEEQQLEKIADSTMDKLLFSMGYPSDWGENMTLTGNSISAIGLQKDGGGVYELDMDKVLRVTNMGEAQLPATIQIGASRMSSLLGLETPPGYEFSLRVSPALNVSIQVIASLTLKQQKTTPSVLEITVLNPDGKPASNANVTGLYLLMTIRKKGSNEAAYSNYTYCTKVASWDGKCTLNFTGWLTAIQNDIGTSDLEDACAVATIYGDYYGVRSPTSFRLSQALDGTIVGRYLIVDFPIEQFLAGAGNVQNVAALSVPPYYAYLDNLLNVTSVQPGITVNAGSKKYCVYALGRSVDDDAVFVMTPIKQFGKCAFVLALRPPVGIISQTSVPGGAKTSVLRRLVRIGSWLYNAEIVVWRQAEY